MGKITSFSIHFDPPQAVFFAGRSICGYVALELKKAMKMKALRIKLTGKEYVSWKERSEEKKGKKTYTSSRNIIDQVVTLLGDGDVTSSSFVHPCGKNSYRFIFQLPPQIPSSFEGRHGYIRYKLKARIEIPWQLDQKLKCQVDVNQLIDTNEPKYTKEVCKTTQKQFPPLFCFVGGGRAELNSGIPRTCFCPGESILMKANIKNSTLNKLGKLKGQLVQYVSYKTPCGKTKNITNVVTILKGHPIGRKNEESWNNQPLNVPMDTTPTITNSKLISVHYKLLFFVGKSKEINHLISEFDIVIGTVPYMGSFKDFVDNFQLQSGYTTCLPPPYPSAPQQGESLHSLANSSGDFDDTAVTTIHVTP